jgi:hypothetical protein
MVATGAPDGRAEKWPRIENEPWLPTREGPCVIACERGDVAPMTIVSWLLGCRCRRTTRPGRRLRRAGLRRWPHGDSRPYPHDYPRPPRTSLWRSRRQRQWASQRESHTHEIVAAQRSAPRSHQAKLDEPSWTYAAHPRASSSNSRSRGGWPSTSPPRFADPPVGTA